jgi:hypothetical protein
VVNSGVQTVGPTISHNTIHGFSRAGIYIENVTNELPLSIVGNAIFGARTPYYPVTLGNPAVAQGSKPTLPER